MAFRAVFQSVGHSSTRVSVLSKCGGVASENNVLITGMKWIAKPHNFSSSMFSSAPANLVRFRRYSSSSPNNKQAVKGLRAKKSKKSSTGLETDNARLALIGAPPTDHASRLSVAYDSFFAGYRPLFVDSNRISKRSNMKSQLLDFVEPSADEPENVYYNDSYTPLGVTSVSGIILDPVMKSLPRNIREQMLTMRPPPPPGQKFDNDIIGSQPQSQVKVFEVELKGIEEILSSSGLDPEELADLRCFVIVDPDHDGSLSVNQEIIKNLPDSLVFVISDHSDLSLSDKGGMQLTSVVRKRRLKIKKHKLRKRRKAQRAMKRKQS
ncbi:hypothetical protein V1511DRAFT_503586 [Dipodascopsis uninucleata]